MATLTVRNVDEKVMRELAVQAAKKGISREEQVRQILEANVRPDIKDWLAEIDRLRAETPPQTTDSTDLIREDRDSR